MEITNRWVLVDVYRPRWTLCSLCACVTTWVRLWSDTCTGCSSKTCVAFNEFSFESRISRLGRLGILCTCIVSISIVSYSCRLCISTCTGKKERFDGFDAGIKGTLKKTELVFLREGIGNSTWLLRDVWKIVNYNCCFIYIPPNFILYFLRQRNLEFSLHMDFHFPMIKGHKTRKEKKKKKIFTFEF